MNNWISFDKSNADHMKALAICLAEWTRQGVTYDVEDLEHSVNVRLNGGF